MKAPFFIILVTLSIGVSIPAQEETTPAPGGKKEPKAPEISEKYRAAVASIDRDLKEELEKLAELRQEIAGEKPEIARKAAESALKLRQKRRQYEVATATQASVDHQLERRQAQLKLWRDERSYFDGLLSEFSKTYRASIPLPEAQEKEEAFILAGKDGDAGTSASIDLVEEAIASLSELNQVRGVKGKAITPDGVMTEGEFAMAGPISWFVSNDNSISGLIRESRSLESEIVQGTVNFEAIRALLEGESATVSFDPTLGNAIAMDEVEGGPLSYFQKGGVWIYPILALALIAFIAAISKWLQLLGITSLRPAVVQQVIDQVNHGKSIEAAGTLANVKHPAARVLRRGLEVCSLPVDDIEEALYEKYIEIVPKLQRGLPFIAIASATAPLLGLLGTVTGMIKTFNQITISGTGDAKSLSGGISEALITTALGLIVAIPALIVHALLTRKIQAIRSTMELVSLAFVNGLKKMRSQ